MCCLLLILTPLASYYLISPEPDSHSSQTVTNNKESDYALSGKVYNFPNQIVLKGETGLPEGAVLTIKRFERDGKTLITKEEVKTVSDGYFQFTTDRLERNKEYIVKVIIYPHLQNESIKKKLGGRGENLKNGESVFDYHHEEMEYSGLMMVGLVNKIEDTTQYVSADFLMSEQEFKDVYNGAQ
jgi:hypothetical protein